MKLSKVLLCALLVICIELSYQVNRKNKQKQLSGSTNQATIGRRPVSLEEDTTPLKKTKQKTKTDSASKNNEKLKDKKIKDKKNKKDDTHEKQLPDVPDFEDQEEPEILQEIEADTDSGDCKKQKKLSGSCILKKVTTFTGGVKSPSFAERLSAIQNMLLKSSEESEEDEKTKSKEEEEEENESVKEDDEYFESEEEETKPSKAEKKKKTPTDEEDEPIKSTTTTTTTKPDEEENGSSNEDGHVKGDDEYFESEEEEIQIYKAKKKKKTPTDEPIKSATTTTTKPEEEENEASNEDENVKEDDEYFESEEEEIKPSKGEKKKKSPSDEKDESIEKAKSKKKKNKPTPAQSSEEEFLPLKPKPTPSANMQQIKGNFIRSLLRENDFAKLVLKNSQKKLEALRSTFSKNVEKLLSISKRKLLIKLDLTENVYNKVKEPIKFSVSKYHTNLESLKEIVDELKSNSESKFLEILNRLKKGQDNIAQHYYSLTTGSMKRAKDAIQVCPTLEEIGVDTENEGRDILNRIKHCHKVGISDIQKLIKKLKKGVRKLSRKVKQSFNYAKKCRTGNKCSKRWNESIETLKKLQEIANNFKYTKFRTDLNAIEEKVENCLSKVEQKISDLRVNFTHEVDKCISSRLQ